jgi:hypothetical protein
MARVLFLLIFLTTMAPAQAYSAPKKYLNLIRCQVNEGYEIAVQRQGRSYYLALLYGDKTEYRERLKKPKVMSLAHDRNKFSFELKNSESDKYLVKIDTQFDEDAASYAEYIHYKLPPNPKKTASYKLYEMAGNGLPLRDLGCYRL